LYDTETAGFAEISYEELTSPDWAGRGS
jgi:hypothetical protein